MTEQVAIDSPGANRRQPLLTERMKSVGEEEGEEEKRGSGGKQNAVIGDFAGGTAACAMMCCCCPCAAVHFLVMAVYKVPAGLFRKAWRKKKKKRLMRKKMKLMMMESGGNYGSRTAIIAAAEADKGRSSSASGCDEFDDDGDWDGSSAATEDGFESEMWDRFHEGGFWRSSLDREA